MKRLQKYLPLTVLLICFLFAMYDLLQLGPAIIKTISDKPSIDRQEIPDAKSVAPKPSVPKPSINDAKDEAVEKVSLYKGMRAVECFILIDGDSNDWNAVKPVAENQDSSEMVIKAVQDERNLYIMGKLKHPEDKWSIYLDTDKNEATGYKGHQWLKCGADYLIDNGFIYKYSGKNDDWSWKAGGKAEIKAKDNVFEFGVKLSDLGIASPSEIGIGISAGNSMNFPKEGGLIGTASNRIAFKSALLKPPSRIKAQTGAQSVEISWDTESGPFEYEIEFDGKTYECKASESFRLEGLKSSAEYKFRIRARQDFYIGDWSSLQTISTKDFELIRERLSVDGERTDWIKAPSVEGNIENGFFAAFQKNRLYFMICGNAFFAKRDIFIDIDGKAETGFKNDAWNKAGAEYLVSSNALYKYAGKGDDWKWEYVKELEYFSEKDLYEAALDISMLGLNEAREIYIGYEYGSNLFIPSQGKYMKAVNTVFNGVKQKLTIPDNIQISSNTKNISLKWDNVNGAEFYEVEINDNTYLCRENSYIFSGADSEKKQRIRLRAVNSDAVSEWTHFYEKKLLNKVNAFSIDGDDKDWKDIDPVAVDKEKNMALYAAMDSGRLYIMLKASMTAGENTICIDSDNNGGTGYMASVWKASGIDYILNDQWLHRYKGKGDDWNWEFITETAIAKSSSMLEISVPLYAIGINRPSAIKIGIVRSNDSYLPALNTPMAEADIIFEQ
ncbi:MAG: fibronectin type III domain-containing protein [Clostridia bacterium]|nr:fibronectin type III domain-containing protein [Clostridia bacterium]